VSSLAFAVWYRDYALPVLTNSRLSAFIDLIAFMSFRFFIKLVEGHPIPFALNYSMGHILQLAASTFLCGPKRQFKVSIIA
jgi:hypothetical protein